VVFNNPELFLNILELKRRKVELLARKAVTILILPGRKTTSQLFTGA